MSRMVKQFYIETKPISNTIITDVTIYSLGIHSLPGNIFILDGSEITMNNIGNFSLNIEEHPISSIVLGENNRYDIYPTVIDIVYEKTGGTANGK